MAKMKINRITAGIVVLLFVFPVTTVGQDYQPGMVVRLVERDLNIPAHPAPGEGAIPFRFQSGSTGTILAVDEQTGWIELLGTPVSGNRNTGWITKRYVAEITGEFDPGVTEDSCSLWPPPHRYLEPGESACYGRRIHVYGKPAVGEALGD